MPAPAAPNLTAGQVYRTSDLLPYGANPTRLAKRLVREGLLVQLAQGLFHCPELSRLGPLPPAHRAVLRGFLGTDDFLITGPPLWAVLGLGVKAKSEVTLAYNAKRSGDFTFGDQHFHLRRVRYPAQPTREWFAVDLVEHRAMAAVRLEVIEQNLVTALANGRFDPVGLRGQAVEYGTLETRELVERCIGEAARITAHAPDASDE
jgi:hypothetical protein